MTSAIQKETRPILTILLKAEKSKSDWYFDLRYFIERLLGETGGKKSQLVAAHKAILGKQHSCFTGNYKYHVWELKDGAKAYINNHRSIGFEVPVEWLKANDGGVTLALASWRDYCYMLIDGAAELCRKGLK